MKQSAAGMCLVSGENPQGDSVQQRGLLKPSLTNLVNSASAARSQGLRPPASMRPTWLVNSLGNQRALTPTAPNGFAQVAGHVIGQLVHARLLRRATAPAARPETLRRRMAAIGGRCGPVNKGQQCCRHPSPLRPSVRSRSLGHLRHEILEQQHRMSSPSALQARKDISKVFRPEQEVRPEGSRLHICRQVFVGGRAMMRTSVWSIFLLDPGLNLPGFRSRRKKLGLNL